MLIRTDSTVGTKCTGVDGPDANIRDGVSPTRARMQLGQAGERAFREFYDDWSRSVWILCRLLLGDKSSAEKATGKAFLAYFHEMNIDDGESPSRLLILALENARKCCASMPKPSRQPTELSEEIRLLPWKEREVFILRGVMDLDEALVSEIVGLSVFEVRQRWFRALMQIRATMPSKFLEGQTV